MREKLEAFIGAWERKAKADMHLDRLLHAKIKGPLIDGIMALVDAEMLALAGQRPTTANEASGLTADLVREVAAKAKAHAIKPKADGTIEVHPASLQAHVAGSFEEAAQMAALKATIKKGKRA